MSTPPRSAHRHALAAPLFAGALLCVLSIHGTGALRADVLSALSDDRAIAARGADSMFSLPWGAAGVLYEDGALMTDERTLSLERGAVTVSSNGLLPVSTGDLQLLGFHGAFTLSRQSDHATVMALTTPVLVRMGSRRLLVPAGTMAEVPVSILSGEPDIPHAKPIPQPMLEEQRTALLRIPTVVSPSLSADPADTTERGVAARRAVDLQEMLRRGDADGARVLLSDGLLQRAFARETLPEGTLSELLADAHGAPSVASGLIDLLRDEDLWMLLSIHGAYRGAAFATPGPLPMSRDSRVLRWLAFPSADILPAAASALSVQSWSRQIQVFLRTETNPAAFLGDLLRRMDPYRAFLNERGMVERVTRYAIALRDIVEPHTQSLPEHLQQLHGAWQSADEIPPYQDPPPSPSIPTVLEATAAPSPQPLTSVEAGALVTSARGLLQHAGALFTADTSLTAVDRDTVAVRAILFADASGGEHTYAFSVHLPSQQISAIAQDGADQPFALSIQQFAAWARGDGGRSPSRYLLFHIPIVLEKKIHFVDNGQFRKGYEKVVVRELDVRSDLWKNSDTEVLAR